ncbi:MAG: DMT family transporter [Paracoccaceae bacterium]
MNPLRGIAFKLLSVAVFMAMSTIIKATAAEVPPGEAMFFRSAFAIPPVLIWLFFIGEFPAALRTKNPMGHVWRGLVGTGGMAFSFLALGLIPLPEAVAIGFAAPILATIFAAMFLGETIRLYRIFAIALGLAGVFLVVWPRLGSIDAATATALETVGVFSALLAAIFAALAQVFVRKLVSIETTGAIVIYFSLTSTCLSLLSAPFGWTLPSGETMMLLILAGLLGGLGQVLLTISYRNAETSVIAPFDYAAIILALLVGWFVFSEAPTALMLSGAGLTVAAGVIIIWRERQLGIERAKSRKVMTPQG